MTNRAVEELEEGRLHYARRISGLDTSHFGAMWHLVTIAHLAMADLDRIAAGQSLSIADLVLLGTIGIERDQPLRPTDLARKLFISNAVLTARVERLGKAGLLVREKSPDDRRAYRLRITPAGNGIVEEAIVRISRESAFVRSLRRIGETDRQTLERILGALHGELLRHGPGA